MAAVPHSIPEDSALPGLDRLFDADWVWQTFVDEYGEPDETPERLRLKNYLYQPGKRAMVAYAAERDWDSWVLEDQFSLEVMAGRQERIFRYPHDPYLPGLERVASALDAHEILPKYVPLHPQRLTVEPVRYHPGSRAVFRHIARGRSASMGKAVLYARVMPPEKLDGLLRAGELAAHSGFLLPRVAGCWEEGGVVWLANTPGKTVRKLVWEGKAPAPDAILDGLAKLWATPMQESKGRALNVKAGFKSTLDALSPAVADEEPRRALKQTTDALRPFVEAWRPSALAHNDFYDDQLILTPTGSLVLVDFEETGPGDPLMDVGTLLAHLSWMARFGYSPDATSQYRQAVRAAALRRFGWDENDLALREAYVLFRLSANPLHKLQEDWPDATKSGLDLVIETLEKAA